jgi:DIS3-like exonuclease 2
MVEEYMLYANIFAGENLIEYCQEVAVLRKHENPSEEKLKSLAEFSKLIGFENDLLKTKDINQFMKAVKESKEINPTLKEVINQKLVRTMQLAKYFVVDQSSPSDWYHFALNFDIYTHFTSPIR